MLEAFLVTLVGVAAAQVSLGPNLVAVASAALGQGRRPALFVTLGVSTGMLVWVVAVSFKHYLELLDWTGRQLRKSKRGSIDESAPSIMSRLDYSPEKWLAIQTPELSWKQKSLGNVERIKDCCEAIGQRWIWQQA